jgi:2'-5' RNA ligase
VFVALDLHDKETIDKIVNFQKELLRTGADIKVVERENLHMTLKFLGDVPDKIVNLVDSRLREIKHQQIDAVVKGVGTFPNLSRPRVVWAGVEDSLQRIISLAGLVMASLEGIGQDGEGNFVPHLTICRVRSGRNREKLIEIIQNNRERTFGPVKIKEIKLKSSTLTPSGPIYNDIGVYPLE